MKDAVLKDLIFRHFWAQRCFVQPEVNVHHGGGTSNAPRLITDIDVLIMRPTPDLTFQRILADCRTLKGQSPINRVLWLAGLLKLCRGHSGYVLLKAPSIEPDHKLAASDLSVTLLSDRDFAIFDRAVLGSSGSRNVDFHADDIRRITAVGDHFPNLKPTQQYFHHTAFHERHFGESIRHALGQMRSVAGEFDPEKEEHLAFYLDICAVFSIGVAECAGTVFHQYLHPGEKEALDASLKIVIWGGSEQYAFYQSIRQKLISRDPNSSPESLELPEWNLFIQLIRHILDQPREFFRVPWILRAIAIRTIQGKSVTDICCREDLLALKFAMLAVSYSCRASNVPRDFEARLVGILVRMQSDLATQADPKRIASGQDDAMI